jgi:hypothetical protein
MTFAMFIQLTWAKRKTAMGRRDHYTVAQSLSQFAACYWMWLHEPSAPERMRPFRAHELASQSRNNHARAGGPNQKPISRM